MRKQIAVIVTAWLICGVCLAASPKAPGSTPTELEKTITNYDKHLKKNPNKAEFWQGLGIAHYFNGNMAKAEDALKRADSIAPDAKSNLYLGLTYEKQNRLAEAIAAYTTALNQNPGGSIRSSLQARIDYLAMQKLRKDAAEAVKNEKAINSDDIPENSIAVVNFDGSKLKADMVPIGLGLAEFTANDLAKVKSLRVVERQKMDAILDELKLSKSGAIDKTSSPRVGRLMGSRRVVTGTLNSAGKNKLRLNGAIANVHDSTLIYPDASEAELKNLFKMEKSFVFSVLDKLGITPTAEERAEIQKVPTESFLAFLAYCRGLDYNGRGMPDRAKEEFGKAFQTDKGFKEADLKIQNIETGALEASTGAQDLGKFETQVQAESPPPTQPPVPPPPVTSPSGLGSTLGSILDNGGIIPNSRPRPTGPTPPVEPDPFGHVTVKGTFYGK